MTQNNIPYLRDKLEFKDGLLYTIMVLQRVKDGNDKNKCLKTYHILNINEYDKICGLIPSLCEANNARAYITIAPKRLEDIGMDMIINASVFIKNKQYNNLLDIFNKTYGSTKHYGLTKWIVDIDTSNTKIQDEIIEFTHKFTKIHYTNKTKNGIHLITSAFNPKEFTKMLGDNNQYVDIDKSLSQTILYV